MSITLTSQTTLAASASSLERNAAQEDGPIERPPSSANAPSHQETTVNPEPSGAEFPVGALSRIMRSLAQEIAATYALNAAMPSLEALTTLAAAIGPGAVVRHGCIGRDTPLNLYAIVAAATGTGKTSANDIAAPLLNASRERESQFIAEIKPGLICDLKLAKKRCAELEKLLGAGKLDAKLKMDLRAEWAEQEKLAAELQRRVRRAPTFWTGNTTTAGLCEVLACNSGATFYFSAEAGQPLTFALAARGKNGAGDLDLLLNAFTGEPYRENRIGRGDQELLPLVTLLWMAQPILVRQLFGDPNALGRGFAARCLVLLVERNNIPLDDGSAQPVRQEITAGWERVIRTALILRESTPLIFEASVEARTQFTAFHNEAVHLQNTEFRDAAGQLARWREQAIRIAGNLAVADLLEQGKPATGPQVLTEDHARRGIEIARWILSRSLGLLRQEQAARQLKAVTALQRLIKSHGGNVTLKLLRDSHGFIVEDVEALAKEFPHALRIINTRKGKKGRMSRVLVKPD